MAAKRVIKVAEAFGDEYEVIRQDGDGIWVTTPGLEAVKLGRAQLKTLQDMLNDQLRPVPPSRGEVVITNQDGTEIRRKIKVIPV